MIDLHILIDNFAIHYLQTLTLPWTKVKMETFSDGIIHIIFFRAPTKKYKVLYRFWWRYNNTPYFSWSRSFQLHTLYQSHYFIARTVRVVELGFQINSKGKTNFNPFYVPTASNTIWLLWNGQVQMHTRNNWMDWLEIEHLITRHVLEENYFFRCRRGRIG